VPITKKNTGATVKIKPKTITKTQMDNYRLKHQTSKVDIRKV